MIARSMNARAPKTGERDEDPRTPSPRGLHDGRVPRECIAKTVVLMDSRGSALAVIPKSRGIDLPAINAEFDRNFVPRSREEVGDRCPGLLSGIPPIGETEGMETFLDLHLVTLPAVYFETENPRRMLRVEGEDFRKLFYGAWCGRISQETAGPLGMGMTEKPAGKAPEAG